MAHRGLGFSSEKKPKVYVEQSVMVGLYLFGKLVENITISGLTESVILKESAISV